MRLFAFLVAVAFWPGSLDPATTLRWAVMAVGAALLLLLSNKEPGRDAAGLFFALIAVVAASLLWTPDLFYGMDDAFHLFAMATVFYLGAVVSDLTPAWEGMAAGVFVSGLIVMLQLAGVSPVEQAQAPAGLMMNKNMLAEAGLAALIPMLMARKPWLCVGPLLAAVVPLSRAVLLALAALVAVLAWRKHRLEATLLALGAIALAAMVMAHGSGDPAAVAAYASPDHVASAASLGARLGYWREALSNLVPFGHGIGSFAANYPEIGHVHSEPIQTLYEFGIFAIVPIAILVYVWLAPGLSSEHLVLAAVLGAGCFSFPLHMPVTGFAAALAAGHLAGRRAGVRLFQPLGRMAHVGLDRAEVHARG